jgi:hypothetical protein
MHSAEGTIVFRACLRQAKLPSEYIVRLVHDSLHEDDFVKRFDTWLLKQILVSIGGATIA